ncbi:MAG: hypothetical protein H6R18_2274 [Proteobacteria bacterium]|nr:hypothetical protein [Pseudomonadota bacterium]
MLREIRKTRQHPGEPHRRWFHSQEQDLYIWQTDDNKIVAFQLCYNKPHNEHALYWREDRGFSHLQVDDGEGTANTSRAPILLADGVFNAESVAQRFRALATNIPASLATFVLERLETYATK